MKIKNLLISWKFWGSIVLAVIISYGLLQITFLGLDQYTNHGVQVEIPNVSKLTLEQAIAKLEESDLEYEVDTSKFDPAFKSYQILDIYPLVGSNVKKGRTVFIRANAKTWKPVTLPSIEGKYKYLAFSQLDLVGLKVSDTIYEPNMATNTVLKVLYKGKEIQPGTILPRFSPLTLVLAKGLAKNVIVPSFIGMNEEDVKNKITENLFSVGSIVYDNPEENANARVYYQVPAPSSVYDQGQPVDVYMSTKPLDKLEEKIRNLDATFNKKYIQQIDSLSPVAPSSPPEEKEEKEGGENISDNESNTETESRPKRVVKDR